MICQDFATRLNAYVDGELDVSDMLAADTHAATCSACRNRAAGERRLRELLRRQLRETAPPELRARILSQVRRETVRAMRRRWLAGTAAAAAVVVVGLGVLFTSGRPPANGASVVARLVDTHSAYAQLEGPAEFASTAPADVEAWFRQRAGLRMTVPDYTPAGIRLVGGRVAAVAERQAAYVLYEKGHTLLSIFMVPLTQREHDVAGARLDFRGHEYVTQERKGFRTVTWTESAGDRTVVFGLVSMLDWNALLECADRLRAERAAQIRA